MIQEREKDEGLKILYFVLDSFNLPTYCLLHIAGSLYEHKTCSLIGSQKFDSVGSCVYTAGFLSSF